MVNYRNVELLALFKLNIAIVNRVYSFIRYLRVKVSLLHLEIPKKVLPKSYNGNARDMQKNQIKQAVFEFSSANLANLSSFLACLLLNSLNEVIVSLVTTADCLSFFETDVP